MTVASPAALCRALLAQGEHAESFTMAEWLATRPDGRAVKDAYTEAARLAWVRDKRLGGPDADAPLESPPGTPPRERERRPALVLTRELRECLGRVERRLSAAGGVPATVPDALREISALLVGPAAASSGCSPPPSRSGGAAGGGGRMESRDASIPEAAPWKLASSAT